MKIARTVTLALALAAVGTLSLPLSAHAGWFQKDSNGTPQYTDTFNNHVDGIKQDMAPHANALFFMQPGSLPQEAWEKLSPAQRDEYARHKEARKGATCGHPSAAMMPGKDGDAARQQRMEKRHAEWEKMTPAQREAAKKRWEARKAQWEKMTPEQRAAAKERWEKKHGVDGAR